MNKLHDWWRRLTGAAQREEAQAQADKERQVALLGDMCRGPNEVALAALAEYRRRGWGMGNIYLFKASLQGADLSGADLWSAHLSAADLRGANLRNANLRGAAMIDTNLSGADLTGADLRGATLYQTQEVPHGVYLGTAVILSGDTILPDGTRWTPDTDMARFTDPAHPDFWRSDDPASPAYRGGV